MPIRPLALRIEWVDPAELYVRGPAHEPHGFWLDAGPDAAEGWSHLGVGTPAAEPPRDAPLGDADPGGDAVGGPFRGGWVGWIGYDGGASRVGAPSTTDTDTAADTAAPDTAGLRVTRLIAFDHSRGEAWLLAPEDERADAEAELRRWRSSTPMRPPADGLGVAVAARTARARHTPAEYEDLISRCRAAIRAGDAYQLCLTTRFEVASDAPLDPVAVYLALRDALPAHHGGIIRVGVHALLSASPERFLEVARGIVRTRPIKGTRPRGTDPAADGALAAELEASVKERAENVMIVDLMRNDLQRVCHPGSVAAEKLLEVESYRAVHQLVSTVAGRLLPGTTLGALLDATFPAGSMTGAPKLSAMTILHALEAAPRGVYAGCFGWVGSDGRLDLAMTIRSIVLHPRGAYVGAGGGITWLSDAREEVAEVAVKARGPLGALGAVIPSGWVSTSGNLEKRACTSSRPKIGPSP
ncbi:anthranilate synthase component I family protein [Microbacterium flavum]|uniref:Anthranilate synthase component I family protein n=1 Tax=Microbacterium flavum TaxID=415216 RepID=A0ABS5XX42_9MICO|nr:anthranilate synthase component I family protein [Microbacterium flavum]MBT8798502.1 anthranilate synthase component I family protein [Microbacterium flavum]